MQPVKNDERCLFYNYNISKWGEKTISKQWFMFIFLIYSYFFLFLK